MAEPSDLNPNQRSFVEHLLASEPRNQTHAYARAYGVEPRVAGANAARLMKDPRIKAAIAAADAERGERMKLTADELTKELARVVRADPRELMEVRRGCCRYCWGEGFKYQRTPAEWERDLEAYMREQRGNKKAGLESDDLGLAFKPQGGLGYNRTREANEDCPECFGEGVSYTLVKDSRTVSDAAARLFVGIKETKDGLEIKTRAVDKSIELAMRNLGLLGEGDKGKDGTPEEKAAKVRELLGALKATTGGSSNGGA